MKKLIGSLVLAGLVACGGEPLVVDKSTDGAGNQCPAAPRPYQWFTISPNDKYPEGTIYFFSPYATMSAVDLDETTCFYQATIIDDPNIGHFLGRPDLKNKWMDGTLFLEESGLTLLVSISFE